MWDITKGNSPSENCTLNTISVDQQNDREGAISKSTVLSEAAYRSNKKINNILTNYV
jgi:hypothetical protein